MTTVLPETILQDQKTGCKKYFYHEKRLRPKNVNKILLKNNKKKVNEIRFENNKTRDKLN